MFAWGLPCTLRAWSCINSFNLIAGVHVQNMHTHMRWCVLLQLFHSA